MHLTPTENDRLTIFLTASLAREAQNRGLRLSLPEAVAVITDTVHWAARSGASYEDAASAGALALTPDQVLDDVASLLDEIRVEPLFEEGTRMVVVRWPLGRPTSAPGEVQPGSEPTPSWPSPRRTLEVVNTSSRIVRISSHYPFHLVNRKLRFDRDAALGWRLALPSGGLQRWAPGQTRTVDLVRAQLQEEDAD